MNKSADINIGNMYAPDVDLFKLASNLSTEVTSYGEKVESIKMSTDPRFVNLPKSLISKVAKIRCRGKKPHRYLSGSVKANFTLK